jgi:hypothetical protein
MGVLNMKDQIDMVNSPPHYNKYGIECIQAIKASMSHLEFCGYLKGNQLKYLWRYRYKGKMKEDLDKAQWYLSLLIEEIEEAENDDTS